MTFSRSSHSFPSLKILAILQPFNSFRSRSAVISAPLIPLRRQKHDIILCITIAQNLPAVRCLLCHDDVLRSAARLFLLTPSHSPVRRAWLSDCFQAVLPSCRSMHALHLDVRHHSKAALYGMTLILKITFLYSSLRLMHGACASVGVKIANSPSCSVTYWLGICPG